MLIGIRHGERADHSQDMNEVNIIEKQYDPHLTQKGCKQAQKTGQYLANYIKQFRDRNELKTVDIQLLCSPFLRTIMTAQNIGLQLRELTDQLYLQTDIQVCEFLGDYDTFPNNIINGYLNYQEDPQKVTSKYLPKDQLIIKNIHNPNPANYPKGLESYKDISNRVHTAIQHYEQNILSDKDAQFIDNRVIIFVSHAGLIDELKAYIGVQSYQMTRYCGICGWEYQKEIKNRKLVFDGNNDHLGDLK